MTIRHPAPLVPGHDLWHEGAPHNVLGERIGWAGVGGVGCGKCTCGTMSETLPSGAQRKAWHREHRRQVAAASREGA